MLLTIIKILVLLIVLFGSYMFYKQTIKPYFSPTNTTSSNKPSQQNLPTNTTSPKA